jgi:hypothetical protein
VGGFVVIHHVIDTDEVIIDQITVEQVGSHLDGILIIVQSQVAEPRLERTLQNYYG